MSDRLRIHVQIHQPGNMPTDWTFDHPKLVTVGYSSKASILLLDPSASPSEKIFEIRSGELCLLVGKALEGHVLLEGQSLSLQSLRQAGLMRKYGKEDYVALTSLTEGDFTLGKTQIRFWVTELGDDDDFPTTPWFRKALDGTPKLFILLVFLSAGIHSFAIDYFMGLPPPPPPTVTEIRDRVVRISVSQRNQMEKEYKRMRRRLGGIKKRSVASRRLRRRPLPKASAGFLRAVRKRTGGGKASPFESLFTTESLSTDLQGLLKAGSMDKLVDQAIAAGGPRIKYDGPENTLDVGPVGTQDLGMGALSKTTSGPNVARISMADPDVQGSLDRQKLQKVIAERSPSLRECYELARSRKPGLSGKLTVKIVVGTRGRVSKISIDRSTVKDRGLQRCVISQIRKWPFPKPDGGPTTVYLPLIFASGRSG